MEGLPNECIYEVLLFLNPKCLQLCAQINNNFNELYQLDSLWRNQIENKYIVLFKKENCYESCKLYYQLCTLRSELELTHPIDDLYNSKSIYLYNNKRVEKLPKEIALLVNLRHLGLHNGQHDIIPLELLPNLDSMYIKEATGSYSKMIYKGIGICGFLRKAGKT